MKEELNLEQRLLAYGYNKAELASKDEAERLALWNKAKGQELALRMQAQAALVQGETESTEVSAPKESEPYWKLLKASIREPLQQFTIFQEMLEQLPLSQVTLLFEAHMSDRDFMLIFKRYRIRYRQYQEELLEELDRLYRIMPEPEHFVQMQTVFGCRDDLAKLRRLVERLKKQDQKALLQRLAEFKNEILKEHFPQTYALEYQLYTETKITRNRLIEQILKHSKIYTEGALRKKSTEELHQIESYVSVDVKRLRFSTPEVKRYLKLLLKEATLGRDDNELGRVIDRMAYELDEESIKTVLAALKEKDELFAQRLHNIYRALKQKS